MAGTYDFVVLGGGHNGLITTAYLAKAGFKVVCLEANEECGGGTRSGEVTAPGYISDLGGMVHNMISGTPIVTQDELGLFSKYGFEYAYAKALFCSIFPDQTSFVMDHSIEKTCENIAQFSKKDAEMYPKFHEYMVNMLSVAGVGSQSPPPPYGLMHNAFQLSPEGREFARVLSSSSQNIVEEWFESEQVRVTFTRWCTEMMIDPRAIGTASLLYFTGRVHKEDYRPPLPKGGSKKFVDALVACCKDFGAEVYTDSKVSDLSCENGEVRTVTCANGEVYTAKNGVISTINIKHVYRMLGDDAPADEAHHVEVKLKHADFGALNQSFALSKIPEFKAGSYVKDAYCIEFAPEEKEYLETFSKYTLGEFSPRLPLVTIPSLWDETRCPAGHAVVNLYSYAPYKLWGDEKNWETHGDELKKEVWDFFKSQTTNITDDDIVGKWGLTPLEYEQWNPAYEKGDIGMIGLQPSQYYAMRPFPGCGQDYHGKIENLYFLGCCGHPGGGIAAGARAGVQKVLEDYGVNFNELVKK